MGLIVIGFANGYYFFKNVFHLSHNNPNLWILSLVSQAVCWYTIPGLFQLFYWFSGHYYYLSFQLAILFVNVYFYCSKPILRVTLIACIIFCLIGSSEISMIMFSGIFCPWQLYMAWKQKKIKLETILFFIIWGISIGLVLLSPGNKVRAPKHIDYTKGLIESILNFGLLLIMYVKSPIIWVFNLLLFVTIDKPKKQYLLSFKEIIGILIFFFISYFLVFVPLAFGLGEKFIPERIQSLILMYLIFGFGYLIVWIKYKVGHINPASLAISQISLLVVFITLLFFNKNSKQFYEEWRFDKAKKYANENAKRFDLILKSKNQHVVIPPIENKNTMFFMEELSTDSKHLWCKCIANYYGKADIHLDK